MNHVFTRDFDLELARENQEARRIARACHTPEELQAAVSAAKAEGFADGLVAGHADGLAAAATADDAQKVAALKALQPQITTLVEEADAHRAALEAQLLDFAVSVCEQVFPELLRHRAHDRALAQVRRALAVGLGSPTLQISLSADALTLLRPDLDSAIHEIGLQGRVEMRADTNLAAGDVRVTWDSGFLEYSFTSICDRILQALRAARPTAPTHYLEN